MPIRIAHRGASAEFPENTLPAMRRALELGADGIEVDVHATRDGIVVLHHDPAVTLPDGVRLPIAEATLAELSAVELAPGVGMPTLGDVLSLVGTRATLFVEVKGAGIDAPLLATLRSALSARVALHSFDHGAIERLSFEVPEIPRGLLWERYPVDVAGAMRLAGARDVWASRTIVDTALVARVHEVGGRLIAWTVNDPGEARRLAAMGVDGLCGDDVRLLPAGDVTPAAGVRGS